MSHSPEISADPGRSRSLRRIGTESATRWFPEPCPRKRKAVYAPEPRSRQTSHPGSILFLAGAGTGETSAVTAAVAHRVAVDRISPSRVLAVTFTNKAAVEMANRLPVTEHLGLLLRRERFQRIGVGFNA